MIPGQCPPPPPNMCLAAVAGEPICDEQTGEWVLSVAVGSQGPFNVVRATSSTIGVNVSGGPNLPLTRPLELRLKGLVPGKVASVDLCGFDGAAQASGRPYDCCRATIVTVTPPFICEKK
jgi:hypothetical protein